MADSFKILDCLDVRQELRLTPDDQGTASFSSGPGGEAGLDDHEILEAVQVVGMFNMTNRVATAIAMVPNAEYHSQDRTTRVELSADVPPEHAGG